ncbi:MAG: FixH family protein [Rhodospirillales bacterium]|nr:FixH family protein [Rhodospirillales bacterium]
MMQAERQITGRMVLFAVAGLFGVFLAANGALVFFALDSWPGLSTDKPYEKGLAYNRTLEAARKQAALGWRSTLSFDGAAKAGTTRVRIEAPGEAPITGLKARVTFRRPVKEGFDVIVDLKETAPGLYAALTALPLAGNWHAVIEASQNGQFVYRMQHGIFVKK